MPLKILIWSLQLNSCVLQQRTKLGLFYVLWSHNLLWVTDLMIKVKFILILLQIENLSHVSFWTRWTKRTALYCHQVVPAWSCRRNLKLKKHFKWQNTNKIFCKNTTNWVLPPDQVFCEAKRTAPSILYIPHIQQWWETAGPALRASFLSLLESIPSFSPILLLATCSIPHQDLDSEVRLELWFKSNRFNISTDCCRFCTFESFLWSKSKPDMPQIK